MVRTKQTARKSGAANKTPPVPPRRKTAAKKTA